MRTESKLVALGRLGATNTLRTYYEHVTNILHACYKQTETLKKLVLHIFGAFDLRIVDGDVIFLFL